MRLKCPKIPVFMQRFDAFCRHRSSGFSDWFGAPKVQGKWGRKGKKGLQKIFRVMSIWFLGKCHFVLGNIYFEKEMPNFNKSRHRSLDSNAHALNLLSCLRGCTQIDSFTQNVHWTFPKYPTPLPPKCPIEN